MADLHRATGTSVKRLQREVQRLNNPRHMVRDFWLCPCNGDLYRWHAVFQGMEGSPYEEGVYHVELNIPQNYPFSAPKIRFLSPSGRFEVGKDICVNGITHFHDESFQTGYTLPVIVEHLRTFMVSDQRGVGGIHHLSEEDRRAIATEARSYACPHCGQTSEHLLCEHHRRYDSLHLPQSDSSDSESDE